MKEENENYRYETEDGRTVIGDVISSVEIKPSPIGVKDGGMITVPKGLQNNVAILRTDKERITIPKKKPKDPKKVIAALRGEITKKQKEIDMLKKVRDYEDEDFKQRGEEIRFLINRNLWQRIINKKYSR